MDHFAFGDAPLKTISLSRVQMARLSLVLPDLTVMPNKSKVADKGGAFLSTVITPAAFYTKPLAIAANIVSITKDWSILALAVFDDPTCN
jgi:hypothetical protein